VNSEVMNWSVDEADIVFRIRARVGPGSMVMDVRVLLQDFMGLSLEAKKEFLAAQVQAVRRAQTWEGLDEMLDPLIGVALEADV